MKTTNYVNTFIEVADDCPAKTAEVPPQKGVEKTAANIQYEMINGKPYQYTSDDVLFGVFVAKNKIASKDLENQRSQFLAKDQACLRASPLTKRYGWGVHSNEEGRVALYAIESKEYAKFVKDKSLKHLKAMRSKRA